MPAIISDMYSKCILAYCDKGTIKFKTFEEYLNSYQLEDSWLIRNLINIPDSREITEEDYYQACFILDQFKIKDISKTDFLINEAFIEYYNTLINIIIFYFNWCIFMKN